MVVGLGNPGPEYERTMHNLGFLAVDRIAERRGIRVARPESKALVGLGTVSGTEAVLVKPLTFMNLSGTAVKPLADRYAVPAERIVVIYDELDLPWTGVRLRPSGSAGGHHGVESVIRQLGSQQFPRIRLGIHPGHTIKSGAEYVLSPIRKAQLEELDEVLDHVASAAESIIAEGVEKAMTRFNRRARSEKQEES
ncbi:MAG TPA: aminoacyl-tRNA hydrolase [Bryobacteraceae bacterium]|nr:aminoacyl-tRNA hydrolase [Bryobacteraceae bacterium]